MSSSLERGVLWNHLLERKSLKVDARWGLLHDGVRIYRITKGEVKELIGKREAPQVLLAALENPEKKKLIQLKNIELTKAETLVVAQAIVKDLMGLMNDLGGGMKEVLFILRGMETERLAKEKEKGKEDKKP